MKREDVDNLLSTFVEIDILEKKNFNIIVESLTRMGVKSKNSNTLYQSCHILHKRGKYYIVHFKEMLALDGRKVNFDDLDLARRNTIVNTLEKWGLCRIIDSSKTESPVLQNQKDLFVVRHADKEKWNLIPKYTIGRKYNNE